jgi:hypothetical protein
MPRIQEQKRFNLDPGEVAHCEFTLRGDSEVVVVGDTSIGIYLRVKEVVGFQASAHLCNVLANVLIQVVCLGPRL